MSLILKPLPGTPFNYSHPLCPLSRNKLGSDAISGAVLPLNEGSGTPRIYLGGHQLTVASSGTDKLCSQTSFAWSNDQSKRFGGPTMHRTAANGLLNCGPHTDFLSLTAATIVVGYKKTDSANNVLISTSTNTLNQLILVDIYGTGKADFLWGGNSEGTSQLTSGTGFPLGDDVWAFSVGPRGMEIWQNGGLIASNTGTPTRSATDHNFQLGVHSFWGSSEVGEYSFVYVYPIQLTRSEIQQISVNPFCFYDWGELDLRSSLQTLSASGTLTTAGATTAVKVYRRLYFDSAASAAAAPAFDAGWSQTTGADRKRLNHVKQNSAITAGSIISWANAANTKALNRQYISSPLSGAQTISGTVKMQLQVREEANVDNVDQMWLAIKVVSIDGSTVRGTLLTHGNYGPTAEFTASAPAGVPQYRNKTGADGDALTLVNALDGDRILVEIGYSNSTAGTTPEARALFGDTGTDLGENETTSSSAAAGQPGWIEFSTSLLFRDATLQSLGGGSTPTGNVLKLVGKIM